MEAASELSDAAFFNSNNYLYWDTETKSRAGLHVLDIIAYSKTVPGNMCANTMICFIEKEKRSGEEKSGRSWDGRGTVSQPTVPPSGTVRDGGKVSALI